MAKPFVVKLAQPGFDVKTTGDENLIYNSNWPLLKTYKSGNVTISDWSVHSTPVISHDLGYVPAFWYFANTTLESEVSGVPVIANRSEFNGPVRFFPGITDSKLVFDIQDGAGQGVVKFQYYIFALDITKPYTAPQIKVGEQGGGRGDTVFKLALPGKDANSTALEDFVVHSDARSPLIHAVFPGKTVADSSVSGFGFSFTHGLGYIPMFFAYVKTGVFGVDNATTDSWLLMPVGGSVLGFTVNEQTISFSTVAPDVEVSLVILKDPFNINQLTSVVV